MEPQKFARSAEDRRRPTVDGTGHWLQIFHDLGLGHPLKCQWEERVQGLTTYSNFWTQL
jgi:hypothetical protein